MSKHQSRGKFLFVLTFVFTLNITGCTGVKFSLDPDPNSLHVEYSRQSGSVLVRVPGDTKIRKNELDMIYEFVLALKESRIYENVYYRDISVDQKVDLVLEPRFIIKMNPYMGTRILKVAILHPFTLGFASNFYWLPTDYKMTGVVKIYKDGSEVGTVEVKNKARWAVKLFSMGETPPREKIKQGLFKQLLQEIPRFVAMHQ